MKIRRRYTVFFTGVIISLFAWILTDPDIGIVDNLPFGAEAIRLVLAYGIGIIGIGILHILRKAIFDYVDFKTAWFIALKSPAGAGLALVALGLSFIAIALLLASGMFYLVM